ncbi:LysR family transcriptional regulator [Variovorax ginsengisoli]|uniref:DNA-binding transcriptional LysR family regulator n=1 Tax=Variovorax ginsengisoli TaxID=363844 RepID=A0ABT9S6D8_9BURK|nr:LysR family transcriptional regulator [Variovorax ginsengisoli]MDP9899311.1 DNA-binding transcriptional LysR family regulator [Variovorax ginsengisoli]
MGPGNRPLDLEWLEDFLALADCGNFSRAAQARSIAQPAFSRHIRGLEEWVGVALFDRSAHPAALTAAGARFLPLLQETLAGLQAARTQARAAHERDAASLSFAATHVLSLTFFPRWLGGIEAQLRLGPIQTLSDSSHACEDLMLQRRVQFVLCHGHAAVPGRLDDAAYPTHRLSDDVLMPVSAPGPGGEPLHALDASARPGAMEDPAVLAYSEASGLGRIVRTVLNAHAANAPANAASNGVDNVAAPAFPVVFTAHHAVLLRTLALEGRGLAWLPLSLVADDLREGRLVEGGAAHWRVPVEIRLYRQPAEMSAAAEALWRLMAPD